MHLAYLLIVSGTLRSNLDPFGLHDDARLWDALKRSHLVEDRQLPGVAPGSLETSSPTSRFTLDSPVEDEGGNLSVGQRSLVSLARAIVFNAKILILDEATASVDYETDKKIQDTIATVFNDRTILCIARTYSEAWFRPSNPLIFMQIVFARSSVTIGFALWTQARSPSSTLLRSFLHRTVYSAVCAIVRRSR